MRELPNLDFLRACAVISVVLEHTLLAYGISHLGRLQVAWIGVVGVFLFFVHTSLVLMWSLERRPHTLDFYIRRLFRIYPLAILVMTIALCLHAPVAGAPDHFFAYAKPGAKSLLYAYALAQNLFQGYSPVAVMWSLPYEIQMYVLLPVIFFFVARNFSRLPLLLFWGMAVLVCRNLFPGQAHNLFLCIPYFLPGVMAYVGFGRDRPHLPAWTFPLALLLLWSLFLCNPDWRRADLLCLATGLLLPQFHQISTRWVAAASHQIAKYSYGIYLTHPFALVLAVYLLPHRPRALQLAVFPVLAYHAVEHPLIRLGSRLANKAEQRYHQRQLTELRVPESEIA